MKKLLRRMVEQAYWFHNTHLASALSALPIIKKIYDDMNPDEDIFILSKGHGCLALYAVLEEHGYKPDWRKNHPDIDVVNGIACTTGSLGHGLPIGVGMALAKKINDEPGVVHVLLGDGECQEGTLWESMQVIKKFDIYNIIIHIDFNGYQAIDKTDNWFTVFLSEYFPLLVKLHRYPKGYGISLFEEHPDWHVHELTQNEYESTMKELADA